MQKIATVKKAVNCVCLNEKSSTESETRATLIFEKLQWLPPEIFTDEDVHLMTKNVYQHVYQIYPSGALAMRA